MQHFWTCCLSGVSFMLGSGRIIALASNSMPRTKRVVAGPSFFSYSMGTPSFVHTCIAAAIATEHCDEVGLPTKMKSST